MTTRSEELTVQERTVVIFDMCSSSNMLENLLLTENVKAMRNLILSVKSFLKDCELKEKCEVYKFIGDGWILLFPPRVPGVNLISFMEELSGHYAQKLEKYIIPHLETKPKIMGLSFGVDRGRLVRFTMMEKVEFIGRPINIAARLQSAIKEKDDDPAYKVLFSRRYYNTLGLPKGYRGAKRARRTLRNILGGENYLCMKLKLKLHS